MRKGSDFCFERFGAADFESVADESDRFFSGTARVSLTMNGLAFAVLVVVVEIAVVALRPLRGPVLRTMVATPSEYLIVSPSWLGLSYCWWVSTRNGGEGSSLQLRKNCADWSEFGRNELSFDKKGLY